MTTEKLKTLFDYTDGNLIRKTSTGGPCGQKGRKIGSISTGGVDRPDKKYKNTKIHGKSYPVHRLIYLWHTGIDTQVDHINRDSLDNRIENLRPATASENMCNRKRFKNNTSGFKGVAWHSHNKKWFAYADKGGKRFTLGYYDNSHDANKMVEKFRQQLHGEFYAKGE